MNRLKLKNPDFELEIETEDFGIIEHILERHDIIDYDYRSDVSRETDGESEVRRFAKGGVIPLKHDATLMEDVDPVDTYLAKYEVKEDINEDEYDEKSEETKAVEDFHTTGIKHDPRGDRYRCRYICPECSSRANHYIPKGVDTVTCYDCDTRMQVNSVYDLTDGAMEKDLFSNWYVAGNARPKVTYGAGEIT